MYLVVCYDITEDRRRTQVCEHLKGMLNHVQQSVFEGSLQSDRFDELVDTVQTRIDPENDTVRIYRLTRTSRSKTTLVGTAEPAELGDHEVMV